MSNFISTGRQNINIIFVCLSDQANRSLRERETIFVLNAEQMLSVSVSIVKY